MLVPHERLDAVSCGELRADPSAMLKRAGPQIVRDANVEGSVALARHDVDAVV